MAQSGFTPISLYYSTTASAVPLAANLAAGELAINITDGKLYYENNSGAVTLLASAAGASGDVVGPASATDNALARFDTTTGKLIQNSVVIVGDTGAVTGVTDLTASGAVTLSGGTANGVAYLNGSKVVTSGSALTFDGTRLTSTTGKFGGGAASNSASLMVNNATNTATGIQLFQDGIESWIMGMPANSAGLAWSASGSEQMRLTSTGLGIGVTNPASKLDVLSASNNIAQFSGAANGYVDFTNGTITGRIQTSGSVRFGSITNHDVAFLQNNTEVGRFTSTGLGIGTSSPSQKLTVNGAALVNGASGFIRAAITGTPTSGVAAIQISIDSTNARTIRMENTSSGGHTYDIINGGTGVGNLGIYDDTVGAYRLSLDSSGNLGLGVTPSAFESPWRALQITAGSGYNAPTVVACAYDSTYLLSNTVYTNGFKYIANNYATQYQQYQGAHKWYTAPSGTAGNAITFTQAMTLDASGRLGIKQTSPTVDLDVGANDSAVAVLSVRYSSVPSYLSNSFDGTSGLTTLSTNSYNSSSGSSSWSSFQNTLYSNAAIQLVSQVTSNGSQIRFLTATAANTNPSEVARIDSSGNFGLGVTPSAWGSNYRALTIAAGSGAISSRTDAYRLFASTNAYHDGTNWRYVASTFASLYAQDSSQHIWYTAPSGTAGTAITFTQAMTLTAEGNLGIGSTSPTNLSNYKTITMNATTGSIIDLQSAGTTLGRIQTDTTYALALWTATATPMVFGTNYTERARIDSSGNLLVGATSQFGGADCKLQGKNGSSAQSVSFLWNATTTGDANFVAFGTEASVTQRGSITYNRAGGLTVYNTTSDYRAKDIYGPVTDSGALIDSVPVYMGKMHGATQERPMFIAHETPAYAHTGEKDAVDTDGNPVYQQMDASALIPVMWAEIQSLRKRLADAGI